MDDVFGLQNWVLTCSEAFCCGHPSSSGEDEDHPGLGLLLLPFLLATLPHTIWNT